MSYLGPWVPQCSTGSARVPPRARPLSAPTHPSIVASAAALPRVGRGPSSWACRLSPWGERTGPASWVWNVSEPTWRWLVGFDLGYFSILGDSWTKDDGHGKVSTVEVTNRRLSSVLLFLPDLWYALQACGCPGAERA